MTLRTALVVLVPEAEPVVAAARSRWDPMAALGVPAHVSVLFPFVTAERIDDTVLAALAGQFAAVAAFDHRFERTAWFGGTVLWLASDADEQFRALTEGVWAAFPDHPPYGGAFDDIVPHLTVASSGPAQELRAVERGLRPHLPVAVSTTVVTLLAEQPSGRWHPRAEFALLR